MLRNRVAALSLVCALVVAACGSGGTEFAPSVSNRTVGLDVLVFEQNPAGSIAGSTRPVTVHLAPSRSGDFELGSIETEIGGAGDMWRASEWAGSSVALLSTGVDPGTARVTFEVTGRIDGPSAGAAMSVAVAAALNGHELLDGVVMTGTINPDGSIGPVGGIPQKVRGAAAAGATTVLIPAGLAESVDLTTGEIVDVVELGNRLGVRVREVDDIFVAYQMFTGKTMSRVPDPISEYVISEPVVGALDGATAEWLDMFESAVAGAVALDGRLITTYGLQGLLDLAADQADAAVAYAQNGRPAAAYDTATYAAMLALQANQIGRGVQEFKRGGAGALEAILEESRDLGRSIDDALARLARVEPTTISEAAALSVAYTFVLDGLGLAATVDDLVGALAAGEEEEAVEDVVEAVRRNTQAAVLVDVGVELLEIGTQIDSGTIDADVDIESITDFFEQAADANVALFESVFIPDVAAAAGIGEDDAKQRLAAVNISYGRTQFIDRVMDRVERSADGADLAYARLGAALGRYVTGAELIATFYSLDAVVDPATLTPTAFKNVEGLEAMFSAAQDQVLRGAALFDRNDADASPVLTFYEMAVAETEEALNANDAPGVLVGLSTMWTAQVYTGLLGLLGGFAGGR